MATLKHLQDSGKSVENTFTTFIPDTPVDVIPSTEPPFHVFKLVKWGKNVYIEGICYDVPNPKKENELDNIWLIRGTNTIWESELKDVIKDIDKPGSRVNKNRMSLHFQDGICRIPNHEKTQLEFARRNSKNVGRNRVGAGKWDYYEYKPEEEQKWRMEKQMSKIKLIQEVSLMPEENMKKLAAWFNIRAIDDYGLNKSTDGIRDELLVIADSRPDEVKKFINSKEVEIAYRIRQAIGEAKIDLQSQHGNAVWAQGGGFIAKIPSNRKAHEYLTELAMTNSEEGRNFKEQLEKIIK
jgi:hypothetical protein